MATFHLYRGDLEDAGALSAPTERLWHTAGRSGLLDLSHELAGELTDARVGLARATMWTHKEQLPGSNFLIPALVEECEVPDKLRKLKLKPAKALRRRGVREPEALPQRARRATTLSG